MVFSGDASEKSRNSKKTAKRIAMQTKHTEKWERDERGEWGGNVRERERHDDKQTTSEHLPWVATSSGRRTESPTQRRDAV